MGQMAGFQSLLKSVLSSARRRMLFENQCQQVDTRAIDIA
jgi:hypothetical protein